MSHYRIFHSSCCAIDVCGGCGALVSPSDHETHDAVCPGRKSENAAVHPRRDGQRLSNLPPGTMVVVGHPVNDRRVVKADDDLWYNARTLARVDDEEFRGGWVVLA